MLDPASDLRPDHWQTVTLIVTGVYLLIIGFLWNVPVLKSILYPFKVLTVAFHEVCLSFNKFSSKVAQLTIFCLHDWPCACLSCRGALLAVPVHICPVLAQFGHALMCVLTGGRVESITLDPDLGGLTMMRGGIQSCTLPAGAPLQIQSVSSSMLLVHIPRPLRSWSGRCRTKACSL